MTMPLQHRETGSHPPRAGRSTRSDWGDRLCCAAIVVAALAGAAVLAWYVWQMPSLR